MSTEMNTSHGRNALSNAQYDLGHLMELVDDADTDPQTQAEAATMIRLWARREPIEVAKGVDVLREVIRRGQTTSARAEACRALTVLSKEDPYLPSPVTEDLRAVLEEETSLRLRIAAVEALRAIGQGRR